MRLTKRIIFAAVLPVFGLAALVAAHPTMAQQSGNYAHRLVEMAYGTCFGDTFQFQGLSPAQIKRKNMDMDEKAIRKIKSCMRNKGVDFEVPGFSHSQEMYQETANWNKAGMDLGTEREQETFRYKVTNLTKLEDNLFTDAATFQQQHEQEHHTAAAGHGHEDESAPSQEVPPAKSGGTIYVPSGNTGSGGSRPIFMPH